MIAVDTSAFMSVLLQEQTAAGCAEVLASHTEIVISCVTLAELLVVTARRGIAERLQQLLDPLPLKIVDATGETAIRVDTIYERWGKGRHVAKLGLIDCFAYDVAVQHDCPLLFVGNDFAQTDVKIALPPEQP